MYRIGQEEVDAIAKLLETKKFFKRVSDLKLIYQVQDRLCEIMDSKYAIMTSSGFGSLVSAMTAMGIGPGDEVIVPGYTYIASGSAVLATGAIPVLAEINESCTLDPEDFERKITPHTKAVMPVHIQGFPCDMDAICAIAKKHNIKVIEDACQADGGSYKGRRLGAIGDAGTFSFNYYKLLSAGEGGAIITSDKGIYERSLIHHDSCGIAFFGNQLDGSDEELFVGSEFRANEISAAIMMVQLDRLEGILSDLRRNKKAMLEVVGDRFTPIPSADIEGDCGTTLAFTFKTADEAWRFTENCPIASLRPINTGKHVYTNWAFIKNKRGAYHPAMDPFLMKENKDLNHNYTLDMCPKTLDILARTVYINVNPDWSVEEAREIAKQIREVKTN